MKLIALTALLLPTASVAQEIPNPARIPPAQQDGPHRFQMPNMLGSGGPGCPSIQRQIADLNKRRVGDGHRLDREPPVHMFLAVDRRIEGCRELTLIRSDVGSGQRKREPGR